MADDAASPRRYEDLSTDELIRLQGVKPIVSVADLAQPDCFESDEEHQAFLDDLYASRHGYPAPPVDASRTVEPATSRRHPMTEVTIEVDDEVLKLVDETAQRLGLPREAVLAQAVRQETARRVLADLYQPREDGLPDDEADELVANERRARRAERRAGSSDAR